MADEFTYPPLTPDPDPAPLSPSIPLNPPMVGEASPFEHVDGQNRDLILESIRAWIRTVLLQWTTAWQNYLVYWLALVAAWLNEFVSEADAYITEHAVAGLSIRYTVGVINTVTPNNLVFTDATEIRPLVVGDVVIDSSDPTRYGQIISITDATHAVVSYLGVLTSAQVESIVAGANIHVDDTDPKNPVVSATGVVIGVTAGTGIAVDNTNPDAPVISNTGVIEVVAGDNVTVDNTDPTHPIVGAEAGSSGVLTIVAGDNVSVDSTDPANPIVSASSGSSDPTRGLVIGTSFTAGADGAGGTVTAWPALLPDAMTFRSVSGSAIPTNLDVHTVAEGSTTSDLLTLLEAHITDVDYGYVFIEVSSFDLGATGGVSGFRTTSNLTRMIELCRKHSAKPVIIGPSAIPGDSTYAGKINPYRTRAQNASARRNSAKLGAIFVNLYAKLDTTDPQNYDTNIFLYPSATGQKMWAAAIAAAILFMGTTDMADDFSDRADEDGTLNPSYTGAAWIPNEKTGSVASSIWGITGGQAYCTQNSANAHALVNMEGPDMAISTIAVVNQGGLALRYDTIAENGYHFDFAQGYAFKTVGTTPTFLGSIGGVNPGDTIDLECRGSQITYLRNGTVVLQVTDTDVPLNNYGGMWNSLNSSGIGARFGSMSVTSLNPQSV